MRISVVLPLATLALAFAHAPRVGAEASGYLSNSSPSGSPSGQGSDYLPSENVQPSAPESQGSSQRQAGAPEPMQVIPDPGGLPPPAACMFPQGWGNSPCGAAVADTFCQNLNLPNGGRFLRATSFTEGYVQGEAWFEGLRQVQACPEGGCRVFQVLWCQ